MQRPPMVRGQPTSSKIGADLKARLQTTGYFTGVALLLHVLVTCIIFTLGYSKGPSDTETSYYSVTVVICGFGVLETCVFAVTSVYTTFQQAKKVDLPTWDWLNSSFLSSVACCSFLVFFLWPALVVFVIHEQGASIFSLMSQIQTSMPSLYSILEFHIISAILMLAIDLGLIAITSFKLVVLQAPRRHDDEDDLTVASVREKEIKQVAAPVNLNDNLKLSSSLSGSPQSGNRYINNGAADSIDSAEINAPSPSPSSPPPSSTFQIDATDHPVVEEADMHQPVTKLDMVLFASGLITNILFFINLCLLAHRTISSGTILPAVLFSFFVLIWIVGGVKYALIDRVKTVSEDWLVTFRLLSVLHFAVTFCFFYISLCVVLLDQKYNTTFFKSLAAMSDGRGALCWLLLLCFPLCIIIYAVIIGLFSRSMWQLDEIASIRLLERTRSDRISTRPPTF